VKNLLHLLVLVVLLLTGAVGAGAADKAASKADVLSAIVVFQKDPSSKEGYAAAETIINFAEKSDAVRISLSKAVVPWLKDKDASDADTRNILLGAYVAGNVGAQLKSSKPVDNVYAGWEQVLVTYAQLLQINSAAKITEVEELKQKDADGTLRAYAAEIAGK